MRRKLLSILWESHSVQQQTVQPSHKILYWFHITSKSSWLSVDEPRHQKITFSEGNNRILANQRGLKKNISNTTDTIPNDIDRRLVLNFFDVFATINCWERNINGTNLGYFVTILIGTALKPEQRVLVVSNGASNLKCRLEAERTSEVGN